jgi:hypothetical protein
MDFAGEFETHLTVALTDVERDVAALRAWGAGRGLKCTHIVLARGRSASQPMLTREGRGTLAGERAAATALAADLAAAGFTVTRVKIEASPLNSDVPRTDTDGRGHPDERYFEHHVKLSLDPTADLDALTTLARRHDAHLSRNALRARDDGRQERFVTQRCHGVGLETARGRLAALLRALHDDHYGVLEHEAEFVVYDGNLALDDGWITEHGDGNPS